MLSRFIDIDISRPALLVLVLASVSTLSSGTNYVVASWAPQLADALHLSSSDINLVAASGNIGVYLTGPLWGLYADKKGARELLYVGACLLGVGYCGLAYSFSNGAKLWMLMLYSWFTGLGSCAGNTAGLNAVARAFSSESRGLAFGIVVACYGLSAFFYSSIAGWLVADDTQAFLVILASGTFISLFGSGLFLTPDRIQNAYAPVPTTPSSNQRLYRTRSTSTAADEPPIESPTDDLEQEVEDKLEGKRNTDQGGISLLKVNDYWALMLLTFCLTGTGLMWINSVGTVVVTLARYNGTPGKITRLQSHQTSLLSIFNCLGRLFIGSASDRVRSRMGIKPVWWLVFIAGCFFISQILARSALTLSDLSWATSLVGFSYGQLYGVFPLILLEWFGLTYFSSNVGMLYMVPTLSSYAFSHLFGTIYDSSTDKRIRRRDLPAGHTHVCSNGAECYRPVFSYTIVACLLAAGLALWLGYRRGGKAKSDREEQDGLAQAVH